MTTDIEHRSLTGSSLHELKGVSSASDYEVPSALSGVTTWGLLDHNSLTETGNPFGAQLLHLRDNAALGVAGGTLTASTWTDRTLDTVVTNEITGASLSASQITLPTGTYYAKIIAPGYFVGLHKIRLQNVTNNTTLLSSSGAYAPSTATQTYASHEGRFTISGIKKIRLQHNCSITNANNGGGLPTSLGTSETYAQVYIWKIA
jgi:hypothetical protein